MRLFGGRCQEFFLLLEDKGLTVGGLLDGRGFSRAIRGAFAAKVRSKYQSVQQFWGLDCRLEQHLLRQPFGGDFTVAFFDFDAYGFAA